MDPKKLFWGLFNAATEGPRDGQKHPSVTEVLESDPALADASNWRPYGGNESNFGIVEAQQASPIAALVEKLMNASDAILMRSCLEKGLDPKSPQAPRSVDEAVRRFFPNAGNWDLKDFRRQQAERIQIVADGPKLETSLIVYDDGEGQHPADFETTFLSLLRGNKTEIHFVQGKYNMGGAGAIVFCGDRRYQLIGSRRFDGTGEFGFTLLRKHPLVGAERQNRRASWYEYLVLDGKVPSFPITSLDLHLHRRQFTTGTVIKLYSYDLPAGARSVISRDLNQSLTEHLFNPPLPMLTVDTSERYPKDVNLQRELFGLKRRLEDEDSKYIAEHFSQELADRTLGRLRVTSYVFRPQVDGRNAKESKDTIQREFFKNNMAVIFSVNGQVHGHYTSEFITRSLKMPLLKDYLLVHVDCTEVEMEVRNELFMASRDRLKEGEESRRLRKRLTDLLLDGRLEEVHKERRAAVAVDSKDTEALLKDFTRNLPLNSELLKLLNHTFQLEERREGNAPPPPKPPKPAAEGKERPPFLPQRYPSFLKIERKPDAQLGEPLVQLPLGDSRTVRFGTDVEDQYLDRTTDPGELRVVLLGIERGKNGGGTAPGLPRRVEEVLNVVKSSPHQGTIRITLGSTAELHVGDAVKLRAELTGAGQTFEQLFYVRIVAPEEKPKTDGKDREAPVPPMGLPQLVRVYRDDGKGDTSWAKLEQQGLSMDHETVMHPMVAGEALEAIYINMDSKVLLRYKARVASASNLELADKRYMSTVYFHTLFLYSITRQRQYSLRHAVADGPEAPVELTDYLKDLFNSHYSEFLLNFGMEQLVASLD